MRVRIALVVAALVAMAAGVSPATGTEPPVSDSPSQSAGQGPAIHRLSKIAEGYAWVTPYWGYHAPHLVYDGEAYYAVGLWGRSEGQSRGVIYRSGDEGRTWTEGFAWQINYQPPMLLLDSHQRVLIVSPQAGRKLKLFRARARGDVQAFEELPVPNTIPQAGYVGAGINRDRLVLAYSGSATPEPHPEKTYDFNIAWLDLATMRWHGPTLLAAAQRKTEPWTTWMYPVVQPDEDGIHLVVNNNPRGSVYDRAYYLVVPWEPPSDYRLQFERVAPADTAKDFIVHLNYMVRQADAAVYVTGRYQPASGEPVQLVCCRRDPRTRQWSQRTIDQTPGSDVNFLHGAITRLPDDPGRLWVLAAYGAELRLYGSDDDGNSWQRAALANSAPHPFVAASYLYVIHPSSGSVRPGRLCGNFNEGVTPHANYAGDYRLWMIMVDVPPKAGAPARSP